VILLPLVCAVGAVTANVLLFQVRIDLVVGLNDVTAFGAVFGLAAVTIARKAGCQVPLLLIGFVAGFFSQVLVFGWLRMFFQLHPAG
jgi:hypothetical protein